MAVAPLSGLSGQTSSGWMVISRLMLCSSEMRVSVDTTPGMVCSLHSVVYQMLYALVNGCTRHAALGCHIRERHTGVGG